MPCVNSQTSGALLRGPRGDAYYDASPLDVGLCFLGTAQPARKCAFEALQL